MRHKRLFLALVSGVFLFSCNRDPEVAKKKYLENGNRYFEKGKYREASIMYRNAIQKDGKCGEAYYRLAVTEWKLGRLANSVLTVLPRRTAPAARGSATALASKLGRQPV